MAVVLTGPATAGADTFGQIGRWGSQGTDPGQFFFSSVFGVDPADNSVYVVDYATPDYRLQKLSRTGTALASVAIPQDAGSLTGIAVDARLRRLYLVQHLDGAATRVLVFSTVPDGAGRLVAPAEVPSGSLPVPGGAAALLEPQAVAVDPSSDDVVIAAENADGDVVIQPISSSGVAGDPFVDEESVVDPDLAGLAIAADGTVYLNSGSLGFLSLYRLAADYSDIAAIDTAATRAAERWFGWSGVAPYSANGLSAGPQLAIDADGTLYWSEEIVADSSPTPGNYLIRGYSPRDGRTSIVYGGRAGGACTLERYAPALAVGSGGTVFALDHSPLEFPAPYGEHVVEFGPGGGGCPVVTPALTVNRRADAAVTVTKGAEVAFDASGTELAGATVTAVDWDLDGSGTFATTSGTSLRLAHRFTRAGTYTVSLRLSVSGSLNGDPEILTRRVTVTSPTPIAAFSASNRTPAAGGSVTFDASASIDPAGTADARASNQLARYSWAFGDGATQVTTTPTVSHAFANPAADAVGRTVKLTVTSRDGVDSAPVTQTVTVQGTAVVLPPPPPPPPPTTPVPPPPAPVVAPKVAIRGVRATSAGVVGLTLACPAGGVECTGAVALTATVRVAGRRGRKARTQTIALGTAAFTVTAGGSRAVTVRLSSRGRGLLAKSRKLKIALRATTRAGASVTSATASATITLPRRARRAKK